MQQPVLAACESEKMRESSQSWKPKSSGTSGELAMAKALQDAKIPYRFQVPIKTKYKEWPFLIDFLVPSTNVNKYLALVVEVDGALHFKTWKGKPAVRRMEKDRVKYGLRERIIYGRDNIRRFLDYVSSATAARDKSDL